MLPLLLCARSIRSEAIEGPLLDRFDRRDTFEDCDPCEDCDERTWLCPDEFDRSLISDPVSFAARKREIACDRRLFDVDALDGAFDDEPLLLVKLERAS